MALGICMFCLLVINSVFSLFLFCKKKIEMVFLNIYISQKLIIMSQYCAICKANNKTKSEYTSHNVIGRGGMIMCKTLLGLTCGYCKQTGHTPKYCPVAKKNNKEKERKEREIMKQCQAIPKPVVKPLKRSIRTLWVDDGEESEVEEEVEVKVEPTVWHILDWLDPEDPFKPQVWPKRAKPAVVESNVFDDAEPFVPVAKVNWDEEE